MNSLKVFRDIVLVGFIQILLLNYINLWGIVNPKLYPVVLVLFYRKINPILLMILGFIYAYIIDLLSFTLGIGMSAILVTCLLKDVLYNFIIQTRDEDIDEYDFSSTNSYYVYIFISLLIFHLVYFFVEIGGFNNIFYVLLKSVASTIFSLMLVYLYNIIFKTK